MIEFVVLLPDQRQARREIEGGIWSGSIVAHSHQIDGLFEPAISAERNARVPPPLPSPATRGNRAWCNDTAPSPRKRGEGALRGRHMRLPCPASGEGNAGALDWFRQADTR